MNCCLPQELRCRRSKMEYSLTVCFVLIGWMTSVSGETTSPHDDRTMPTIGPAYIGNITLSPSTKVNYSLEVWTSGPAVMDSIMVFTAHLFVQPNHTTVPDETERFRFLWLNSADHKEDHTQSGYVSKLHKTFSQKVSGDFLMTVVVSPVDRPTDILSFSNTVFRLTEGLNGNLKVKQKLDYQRSNTTFAIDRPIHFHVDITDHFSKSNFPKYTFFWCNGTKLLHVTYSPHLDHNFSEPNVLHLKALASAEFVPVEGPSHTTPGPPIPDKVGSFTEKLHFKASLSNCSLSRTDSTTGDQSLKLGNALVLSITCTGSSPSAVCWNVTKRNATLNETCRPAGQFANTTQHNVTVTVGATGWNTVHLAIYNDIGFQLLSQDYYVYDADSVNIPALVVFPVVFIVLGGIIVAAGLAYIVRLRRRLHVEVADFDFDPTISVKSSSSWSSIVPAVRHFFWRSRHRATSSSDDRHSINRSRHLYQTL